MSNFEKKIIESIENEFENNILLPDYESIILYLYYIVVYTGQCNIMFCNSFIQEAIQLLKNSLILYKKGFFDCAFYSIRQSSEVMDSMLYLAKSPSEKVYDWKSKNYFPVDSKVRQQLEKISNDYKEIKSLLPDFFRHHEELIIKIHKIIHKQGFDTFYQLRTPINRKITNYSQEDEIALFLETLKYTIGKLLILIVILDPMCLALADENVNGKINMNLMTEPIDTTFFENILGLSDIVSKIKSSNYYKDFVSYFKEKEEMLPATYSVIREQFWNIEKLNEIESQFHMLSTDEKFMFNILKRGIKASLFYYAGGLGWYYTSNMSNLKEFSVNTIDFQNYTKSREAFNQKRKNVYISVIKQSKDDFLFIEHNMPFNKDEINKLLELEKKHLKYLEKCEYEMDKILNL